MCCLRLKLGGKPLCESPAGSRVKLDVSVDCNERGVILLYVMVGGGRVGVISKNPMASVWDFSCKHLG